MALLKRAAVRAIFSSQSSHLQSCMDMLLLCITGCSKGKNANKAAKRLRRLEDVCRARAEVAGQHATSGGSVLGVTEAPRKAANFRFTIEPARKTISRSTAQTCISLDHRHQQPLVMRQSWHSFPDRRSCWHTTACSWFKKTKMATDPGRSLSQLHVCDGGRGYDHARSGDDGCGVHGCCDAVSPQLGVQSAQRQHGQANHHLRCKTKSKNHVRFGM